MRDGREQTFDVHLGELKASAGESGNPSEPGSGGGFGLSIEPLTRATARELGVNATAGVVVTGVEPGSRAADAGLREGDVISEVDGTKIATGEALKSALTKESNAPALLLVQRGDATVYVPLDRK